MNLLRWIWERWGPWLAAALACAVLWLTNHVAGINVGFLRQYTQFLLGASITSGAVFTSFLATSLSFLLGVDTPVARRVRETKYNDLLLIYYREAIFGSLAFCLLSLLGYFIRQHNGFYFYIWGTIGVLPCSRFGAVFLCCSKYSRFQNRSIE